MPLYSVLSLNGDHDVFVYRLKDQYEIVRNEERWIVDNFKEAIDKANELGK